MEDGRRVWCRSGVRRHYGWLDGRRWYEAEVGDAVGAWGGARAGDRQDSHSLLARCGGTRVRESGIRAAHTPANQAEVTSKFGRQGRAVNAAAAIRDATSACTLFGHGLDVTRMRACETVSS